MEDWQITGGRGNAKVITTFNAIVLFNENQKLKELITEIKEIAEPFCNACQEFEPEKRGRDCMYCNYGKILQKISESEVEDERKR